MSSYYLTKSFDPVIFICGHFWLIEDKVYSSYEWPPLSLLTLSIAENHSYHFPSVTELLLQKAENQDMLCLS